MPELGRLRGGGRDAALAARQPLLRAGGAGGAGRRPRGRGGGGEADPGAGAAAAGRRLPLLAGAGAAGHRVRGAEPAGERRGSAARLRLPAHLRGLGVRQPRPVQPGGHGGPAAPPPRPAAGAGVRVRGSAGGAAGRALGRADAVGGRAGRRLRRQGRRVLAPHPRRARLRQDGRDAAGPFPPPPVEPGHAALQRQQPRAQLLLRHGGRPCGLPGGGFPHGRAQLRRDQPAPRHRRRRPRPPDGREG